MTAIIDQNQGSAGSNNGKVMMRAFSNSTVTIASLANGGETVTAFNIGQVYWSGPWTIMRGTSMLLDLSATANNAGHINFESDGNELTANSNQSIVLTTSAANATIIVVGRKQDN